MSKAYMVEMYPEDVEPRFEYVIVPDDWEIPSADDTDAHDMILSENDGYYVSEVFDCSVEEAMKNNPWSI